MFPLILFALLLFPYPPISLFNICVLMNASVLSVTGPGPSSGKSMPGETYCDSVHNLKRV